MTLTSFFSWAEMIMEIDHEIISTAILLLPLIQEGQLPVSFEYENLVLINRLGGLSLPRNNASRLTDRLDMTLIVSTGS